MATASQMVGASAPANVSRTAKITLDRMRAPTSPPTRAAPAELTRNSPPRSRRQDERLVLAPGGAHADRELTPSGHVRSVIHQVLVRELGSQPAVDGLEIGLRRRRIPSSRELRKRLQS